MGFLRGRNRWRKLTVLSWGMVVFLVSPCLLSGCQDMDKYPSATACFVGAFGHSPGPEISQLQGEGAAFRDSGYMYLRFTTSRSRLSRLLGSDFRPLSREEFKHDTDGIQGPSPDWWRPLTSLRSYFYTSNSFHPEFSQGHAFVAYDPETNTVFWYWDGID